MSWYRAVSITLLALLLASALVNADKIPNELQAALEKAEQFEVFSLSPRRPKDKPRDTFHGWEVLGKTTVKDARTRTGLLTTFKKGVEENDGKAALCFNPRHGIRVFRDGKTTDFVICFECFQVQTYEGKERREGFLITASPQTTFDEVLRKAGVPLPKKRGE